MTPSTPRASSPAGDSPRSFTVQSEHGDAQLVTALDDAARDNVVLQGHRRGSHALDETSDPERKNEAQRDEDRAADGNRGSTRPGYSLPAWVRCGYGRGAARGAGAPAASPTLLVLATARSTRSWRRRGVDELLLPTCALQVGEQADLQAPFSARNAKTSSRVTGSSLAPCANARGRASVRAGRTRPARRGRRRERGQPPPPGSCSREQAPPPRWPILSTRPSPRRRFTARSAAGQLLGKRPPSAAYSRIIRSVCRSTGARSSVRVSSGSADAHLPRAGGRSETSSRAGPRASRSTSSARGAARSSPITNWLNRRACQEARAGTRRRAFPRPRPRSGGHRAPSRR